MGCADASSAIALEQDVGELTGRGWDGTWKGRGWLRGQDVDGLMGGGVRSEHARASATIGQPPEHARGCKGNQCCCDCFYSGVTSCVIAPLFLS